MVLVAIEVATVIVIGTNAKNATIIYLMNPLRGKVYLPRAVLPFFAFVLGLYLSFFSDDCFDLIFLVGFAYVYAIIVYALQEMHSSSSVGVEL